MNSASNYRHHALEKLSNGLLAVNHDQSQGSFVIANESLQPGQVLLECPSASIALDPAYRQSHCGFCANAVEEQCTTCPDCQVQKGASGTTTLQELVHVLLDPKAQRYS